MSLLKNDYATEIITDPWLNEVANGIHHAATVDLSAGDVTLTAAEYQCRTLILVGALTANRNVVVPADGGRSWIVVNDTTGAFSATVKTLAGSGITVAQTKTAILRENGTDVKRVTADV